jgi:hypothetical protein
MRTELGRSVSLHHPVPKRYGTEEGGKRGKKKQGLGEDSIH